MELNATTEKLYVTPSGRSEVSKEAVVSLVVTVAVRQLLSTVTM